MFTLSSSKGPLVKNVRPCLSAPIQSSAVSFEFLPALVMAGVWLPNVGVGSQDCPRASFDGGC